MKGQTVFVLGKPIGSIIQVKRRSGGQCQLLLIILWIGRELVGGIAGFVISGGESAEEDVQERLGQAGRMYCGPGLEKRTDSKVAALGINLLLAQEPALIKGQQGQPADRPLLRKKKNSPIGNSVPFKVW